MLPVIPQKIAAGNTKSSCSAHSQNALQRKSRVEVRALIRYQSFEDTAGAHPESVAQTSIYPQFCFGLPDGNLRRTHDHHDLKLIHSLLLLLPPPALPPLQLGPLPAIRNAPLHFNCHPPASQPSHCHKPRTPGPSGPCVQCKSTTEVRLKLQ